jgi:epoxyqueuosine reductase
MFNSKEKNTQLIKQLAYDEGFFFTGIAAADFLKDEAPLLEKWLKQNYQGEMSYMNNHFDKRLDPRLLVPGATTVVTFLLNYFPDTNQHDHEAPKLSKYAFGDDYHFVIKDKLKNLVDKLKNEIGDFDGRVFVDSAPVMDKAWAKKSGAGWMGKHTNIINKQNGSYFFIAELICDLSLVPDGPVKDYCGTCTKCIDACPTDAIVAPYQVDGSKCISYLTIELKEALLPQQFKSQMENWMFGCDICQDVCPWNRFSKPHNEPRFLPSELKMTMTKADWEDLNQEVFSSLFKNSAVKRAKFEGLKRNIGFLK